MSYQGRQPHGVWRTTVKFNKKYQKRQTPIFGIVENFLKINVTHTSTRDCYISSTKDDDLDIKCYPLNRLSFLTAMKQQQLIRSCEVPSKKQSTRKFANVKEWLQEKENYQNTLEKTERRRRKTKNALQCQAFSELDIQEALQKIDWENSKGKKRMVRL